MSEITEFVNTLFEKSKILNDLNTQFLSELMVGDLSQVQKLELFYKNTKYHESILKSIEQIVKDLDKTSVLLSPEQKEITQIYRSLDDLSKNKMLQMLRASKNTMFVPKNLTTCPYCGDKLLPASNEYKGCKKSPLVINGEIFGYTVDCLKKKGKKDELESND